MRQYEMYELTLTGPVPAGSHVEVDVTGVFTAEDGAVTTVKGFYAGNGSYKVRFLPEKTGTYTYVIDGVVKDAGQILCEPAKEGAHGVVRAEGTHFRYADGTWCYPVGTTIYALSHQDEELTEQTFATLAKAPFNKIRMCVFPKHYDFNHNKPPYYAFETCACDEKEAQPGVYADAENADVQEPGKWDVHHPCFAFWDRFESHLTRLFELGIQSDLIVFHPYDRWGFSKLPLEEALVYLDYLTRRFSAFPNLWWSLANEYDLMNYSMEEWKTIAHFIREHDAFGHLLSNHEMVVPWDYANPDTTHICHQTSYIETLSLEIEKYQKPLMVDECCYEGNIPHRWGNISGQELVHRFWTVCMQGGYCTHGETFLNEEGILWWARGGKLVGESPARIAFLKGILQELPGPLTFASFTVDEETFYKNQAAYTEEQKKNDFIRLLSRLTWEQGKDLANSRRELFGAYQEEAYLKYYGKRCTSIATFALPEEKTYDIEVIDTWEMTRTKVMSKVSGNVEVALPGKEGMAVLASVNSTT